MRVLQQTSVLVAFILLSSFSNPTFVKDNSFSVGKVSKNVIQLSIGEGFDEPLAIYLHDKKSGKQLKYKFWKPGYSRDIKYNISNYHVKSYVVVVKKDQEVLFKKAI